MSCTASSQCASQFVKDFCNTVISSQQRTCINRVFQSVCCHAELQLAAQQAEEEERAQAADNSDPQPPAQQPHTAPQQPGLTPKGTPHQAAVQEGPPAPSGTPKAATPRAAVGSHAHFAETPAADMGEQDRIGLGQHHLKMPL